MSIDLSKAGEIAGFIAACLVDSDTGLMLASHGGGKLDLETASALHSQIVRAKRQSIETLGLNDEHGPGAYADGADGDASEEGNDDG